MPGVTVTAGGVVGDGADGGGAVEVFVVVGALVGVNVGACVGVVCSRRGFTMGITALGVPVFVGVRV